MSFLYLLLLVTPSCSAASSQAPLKSPADIDAGINHEFVRSCLLNSSVLKKLNTSLIELTTHIPTWRWSHISYPPASRHHTRHLPPSHPRRRNRLKNSRHFILCILYSHPYSKTSRSTSFKHRTPPRFRLPVKFPCSIRLNIMDNQHHPGPKNGRQRNHNFSRRNVSHGLCRTTLPRRFR